MHKLTGNLKIPGDKSISHRALIFSAISNGKSEIFNLLVSEDTKATIKILKNLGIKIIKKKDKWIVYGNGTNGFLQPVEALDAMNSGTSARTLIGAVSSNPITCQFIGDKSLSKRSMSRVTVYLSKLGADIKLAKNNFLPCKITGSSNLIAQKIIIQKPSAQIKTALIFAGLNIDGKLTIIEKIKTRDHTEKLMDFLKIKYKTRKMKNGSNLIQLRGPYEIVSKNLSIAGDPSSAAFFVVGGLIVPDSNITIQNVLLNPTRIEYINVLKKMGGKIKIEKKGKLSGEIYGNIHVKYSKLKGVRISSKQSPLLIDEYPILSIAASVAVGQTVMNGLDELRHKESDRIFSIVSNLKKAGIKVKSIKNNIHIHGATEFTNKNCLIKSHDDHRISCSFMILRLVYGDNLAIDNEKCVSISYPNFKKDLNKLLKRN